MDKTRPLYEVRQIEDLRQMLASSSAIYGDKTLFKVKDYFPNRAKMPERGVNSRSKTYQEVSFKRYLADVEAMATYFYQTGIKNGKVAILGETRYEWYVTYMAATNGYGVVVPLDKEMPSNEIMNLISRAEIDILVYAKSKAKAIEEIRSELVTVKQFIVMDAPQVEADAPTDIWFWDALAEGSALRATGDRRYEDAELNPEQMRILLFTSGTTAKSKAVMLNHKNICKNLMAMCQMVYIDDKDTFLSVLPIHHTYECTCGFLCQVYRGCTIAVCEGLRYIVSNMNEAKVTMILVVPLMIEAFYRQIRLGAKATQQTWRKFRLGLNISHYLRKIGVDKRRKLFSQVHEKFGGHIRLMISGGAPIAPEVLTGMQDLGFNVIQGYGVTECAPILALNRDCFYNNNAAGIALPGVEIKLTDIDDKGIGEICGKGDNVMLGYFGDSELTSKAIDSDGFYHTGDMGYIDNEGFVIITGRKANVIVTKNGKNIFPEEIEMLLAEDDWIAEVLVSRKDNADGDIVVHADIFPSEVRIKEEETKLGRSLTPEEITAHLAKTVKRVNHRLETYKYVRSFEVVDHEFAKTTSKKIKRARQ